MPIPVRCPACDRPHNLADALAGKKIRCKNCQAVVAVPAAGERDSEAARAPLGQATPRAQQPPEMAASVVEGQPLPTRSGVKGPTSARRGSRKRLWIVLLAVAALLLFGFVGGGLALWLLVWKQPDPERWILAGK